MEITVHELAPGLNGSNGLIRMHFRSYGKVKDRWQLLLREAAGTRRAPDPCHIHMHRYYCGQPMDIDNLYSTCKIPLDAMRAVKIIREDDPSVVSSITMTQSKVAKRTEQRTVITITPSIVA